LEDSDILPIISKENDSQKLLPDQQEETFKVKDHLLTQNNVDIETTTSSIENSIEGKSLPVETDIEEDSTVLPIEDLQSHNTEEESTFRSRIGFESESTENTLRRSPIKARGDYPIRRPEIRRKNQLPVQATSIESFLSSVHQQQQKNNKKLFNRKLVQYNCRTKPTK